MSERASFSERGIDKYDNNGIGERGKPKVRIAAATTPTTNGLAVTTGYLMKLSVTPSKSRGGQSTAVWKRRFFMLRGCTLTYYSDHQSMDSPKGELLVFGETMYEVDEVSNQKHSFTLAVPFALINLACETGIDFFLWTKAIKKSIALAQQALRGYIDKVVESEETVRKKYFILHQDAITFHRDEHSTSSVQGLLHLNDNTSMEFFDRKKQITITDTNLKHSLTLLFDDDRTSSKEGDYVEWKEVIITNLRLYSAIIQDAETSFNPHDGLPNMIKKGMLRMRPPKGGEAWPELLFFLNEAQIVAVGVDADSTDGEQVKMVGDFEITPNCSVFETTLGQNTFELVTASKVLHVCATSPFEVMEWIDAIREAISRSYLDTKDPLFQQSILKIDNDEFYTVQFTEKKPLGVVFERSGEWAIIKSSVNPVESGIAAGSALSAIDDKSVVLNSYLSTIDRLKGWRPPLSLSFRRAPSKGGYLLKESKSRSNPTKKVWKKRYFVLGEGKLLYKDSSEAGARVKGECPLMGSVVSMIKEGEAGKRNCFKLMSGMMYLTLQCSSERQMMDWASSVYHAISIANGGAYVLQYERDRVAAEEEDYGTTQIVLADGEESPMPSGYMSKPSRSGFGRKEEAVTPRTSSAKSEKVEDEMRSYHEANAALSEAMLEVDTMDIKELEAVIKKAKREGIDVSIAEKQLSMRRIFELQVDENMRKDTASKQSTEMQLEASMYAAKYDTFGDLVKMICVAKASGVEVGDAEKKLLELKAEKDRKNEILSILEASMVEVRPENIDALELAVENAEQEGLNVVQAQLLLLQMRNERRKVADAAAQLVKVVQSVGYDAESLENLELAISQAIDAHVSKENIEKARQLLDSLKEGKQLLDEAMIVLQAAMKERNLPNLVEAVSTASEIGFHHEQLQDDLNNAKAIINEIKKDEQDDSLKKITEESTEDSYEALMSAIERSKGTKCNPVRLANAQAVLADLKQRKSEKDEIMYALRFAINERDVGLIISALQSANAKGIQGPELDSALSLVWTLQRKQAEENLLVAVDSANVNDFASLERLVAQLAAMETMDYPATVEENGTPTKHNLNDKVGAGQTAVLMANSRLTQLKATKKEHVRIQESLETAMKYDNMEDVERAVSEADEIGFNHPSIEQGRALLAVMNERQKKLIARAEEEQSRQEQVGAEKARALAAIEAAMRREEPLASTLKRALDNAAALGITREPVFTEGNKMLIILNKNSAGASLLRAMDTAKYNRDPDALKEVIAKAIADDVDPKKIAHATKLLNELKEEKEKKRKAIALLDSAVESRDPIRINAALEYLTNNGGATGPEVEKAHKVVVELKREKATATLQAVLNTSTVMTAQGFDEEKYLKLCQAVEDTDRNLPPDNELLVKAKARLEEQRVIKRKCNNASAAVARAMESRDVAALELALTDATNLLSADSLSAGTTMLASLKQTAAAAKLSTAIMSSTESSKSLAAAVEQAKRDGVKAHKIREAENRLVKLRKDEVIRNEIDNLLLPAIESRNVEQLELHLHNATHCSVTSKTIEAARLLSGQLRNQGDRSRIEILLRDSLRLRSVAVLEHVVKSAVEAGITGDLLDRAREYLDKLRARDRDDENGDDFYNPSIGVNIPQRDKHQVNYKSMIRESGHIRVENSLPSNDDYSDGDDDMDDDPDESQRSLPSSPKSRRRRTLFRDEDASVEYDFKCLFSSYCSKGENGAPGYINAMQFSSIWRMITGEKGNLFKEMQMYKRFDASNRGALSLEDFLDGWAKISMESGGSTILKRVRALAAEGFSRDNRESRKH